MTFEPCDNPDHNDRFQECLACELKSANARAEAAEKKLADEERNSSYWKTAYDSARAERDQAKADAAEYKAIATEAVELGKRQAEEWDRFWAAIGCLGKEVTVEQAIAKWQELDAEKERLRRALFDLHQWCEAYRGEMIQFRWMDLSAAIERAGGALSSQAGKDAVINGVNNSADAHDKEAR